MGNSVAAISLEQLPPDELKAALHGMGAYELGTLLNEIAAALILLNKEAQAIIRRRATAEKALLLNTSLDAEAIRTHKATIAEAKADMEINKLRTRTYKDVKSITQTQLRAIPA